MLFSLALNKAARVLHIIFYLVRAVCSNVVIGKDGTVFHPGCWHLGQTLGCPKMGTAEPSLCPQGKTHWTLDQIRKALPRFAHLYSRRPIKINTFGMNTNHAFAMWYVAQALQPKHVIESGVWCGQGTWLLRQALGPKAWIYVLDPRHHLHNGYMAFRDWKTGRTRYFTGENFKDLRDMDWDNLIPPEERSQTLVVLDDHQASIKRVRDLLAHNFIHLFYDDNANMNLGEELGGDTYSFNMVCSPLPLGVSSVQYKDELGSIERQISLGEHDANLKYLMDHVEVYFEFPPIFDGCHEDLPPFERYGADHMHCCWADFHEPGNKNLGGISETAEDAADCEQECAAKTACAYFSYNKKWKTCHFCDSCRKRASPALGYISYKKTHGKNKFNVLAREKWCDVQGGAQQIRSTPGQSIEACAKSCLESNECLYVSFSFGAGHCSLFSTCGVPTSMPHGREQLDRPTWITYIKVVLRNTATQWLSNKSHLQTLRLPAMQEDPYHYMHLYPPYVKLRK